MSNRCVLISILFAYVLLTQFVRTLHASDYALALVDKKRVPYGSWDLKAMPMTDGRMFFATTSGIRLWSYPAFYKFRKVAKFDLPEVEEPGCFTISPSGELAAWKVDRSPHDTLFIATLNGSNVVEELTSTFSKGALVDIIWVSEKHIAVYEMMNEMEEDILWIINADDGRVVRHWSFPTDNQILTGFTRVDDRSVVLSLIFSPEHTKTSAEGKYLSTIESFDIFNGSRDELFRRSSADVYYYVAQYVSHKGAFLVGRSGTDYYVGPRGRAHADVAGRPFLIVNREGTVSEMVASAAKLKKLIASPFAMSVHESTGRVLISGIMNVERTAAEYAFPPILSELSVWDLNSGSLLCSTTVDFEIQRTMFDPSGKFVIAEGSFGNIPTICSWRIVELPDVGKR